MENYNKLRRPPKTALRQIKGGRLSGKTDISPQWRYEIMTEVYGECGIGWKFKIERVWTEPGTEGVVFAFAQIGLQIRIEGEWSEPIPGVGGHQMVVKEKAGLYNNDEAFKMAVTDALGTAMKMLGVAADIYSGLWDGSKYTDSKTAKKETKKETPPAPFADMLTKFATAKGVLNKKTGDDSIYYSALETLGVKHCNEIKKVEDGNKLLAEFRTFLTPKKEEKEEEIPY